MSQFRSLSGLLSFDMITFWSWYWIENLYILCKPLHFLACGSKTFVVFFSGSNNSRPGCEDNSSWELCTKSWNGGKYSKNSHHSAHIDVKFRAYQKQLLQEVRVVENAINVAPSENSENVSLSIEVKPKIQIKILHDPFLLVICSSWAFGVG